jgi:hypothetical protein
MKQPEDKTALLDLLRREKAHWEALLQLVSEEEMLLPGVTGDWTFKDVVAHLTVWRKRTVARFIGAQQGGEVPPPEFPTDLKNALEVNEWMYRVNRDRPLAEVLAESQAVWEQLVDIVEALPEADLFERRRYEWMQGRALGPGNLFWSFEHLHEHAAHINDWLARRMEAEGSQCGL